MVPLFFMQQVLSFFVPKFSFLGLKLFDVLSLANTWQALGFSVFLALDTLISISCPLRATEVG